MSDLELPPAVETTSPLTFEMPNVLLRFGETCEIRPGGMVQVEMRTRVTHEEKVPEEALFRIRGTHGLSFGNQTIAVINDATQSGERQLPASNPTAAEYMALVGKEVLHNVIVSRNEELSKRFERDIYRVARSTFILP